MNIMTSRVMASIRATNLKPVEYKIKYLSEDLWYVPNSILKKTEVINWPLKHWFSFFVLLAHLMGRLLKRIVILGLTKTSINCQRQCLAFYHFILTYFHPTFDPQQTQKMSATVCIPVIIVLFSISPEVTFTLSKETKGV